MLKVKEVKTNKEKRDFLNFPLKMYKDNKNFVPPLYIDEKKIFSKKYIYYDTCEAIYFNCYDDDKIVGRISAILQKASNEKWNQKRVRFTRFDAINDVNVAKALFLEVEKWAKAKQMDEIVGPLGFSDLEREGLLIEGFDELATFEEQYNAPYYQKLIEECGYEKEVDWLEHKLTVPKDNCQLLRLEKLSDLMMKRYNLHYANCKSISIIIKRYGKQIFQAIDKTYENIYGTVPFTDGMRKMMIDNFKLIVRPKDVALIVDENDRLVCFGIIIPSISKAVQKSSGHLTIPTIVRILKAKKNPEIIDLGLIGVLPEYEMKGIASSALAKIIKTLEKDNIKYAETNLNLETNYHIINQWKNFDAIQHKRRRCFIKKIN